MNYRIARQGTIYGPYTEDELREYYAAGNVVADDLAQSEGMQDWKPLRKVLPKLKKQAKKAKEEAAKAIDPTGLRLDLPAPPDIPWWLAMILEAATSLTFFVAWDIVEAVWLRRVQKQSRAIIYAGFAGGLLLVEAPKLYSGVSHGLSKTFWFQTAFSGVLLLAAFVLRLMARFSMRNSLLEHFNHREPIGLHLSKFMTLLFGGLYFQYHFNRINEARRLLQNRPAPAPSQNWTPT